MILAPDHNWFQTFQVWIHPQKSKNNTGSTPVVGAGSKSWIQTSQYMNYMSFEGPKTHNIPTERSDCPTCASDMASHHFTFHQVSANLRGKRHSKTPPIGGVFSVLTRSWPQGASTKGGWVIGCHSCQLLDGLMMTLKIYNERMDIEFRTLNNWPIWSLLEGFMVRARVCLNTLFAHMHVYAYKYTHIIYIYICVYVSLMFI